MIIFFCFFFQAEDGIRDRTVTGVQTCALPIYPETCFCSELELCACRWADPRNWPGCRIVLVQESSATRVESPASLSTNLNVGRSWLPYGTTIVSPAFNTVF